MYSKYTDLSIIQFPLLVFDIVCQDFKVFDRKFITHNKNMHVNKIYV